MLESSLKKKCSSQRKPLPIVLPESSFRLLIGNVADKSWSIFSPTPVLVFHDQPYGTLINNNTIL